MHCAFRTGLLNRRLSLESSPDVFPTTNAQVYLERAAEVEEMARAIRFDHEREAMLNIARQWRVLAEEAARREGNAFSKDATTKST